LIRYTSAFRYESDRLKLRRIIIARTAEEVKANIDSTVIEPAGLDSPVAFWSGLRKAIIAPDQSAVMVARLLLSRHRIGYER
jgi:hypothetical protein